MQKKLVALVVVLLVCASLGAFAAEQKSPSIPWWVSFNSPGTLDLAVGVGSSQSGLGAQADLNLTFGQFLIGPIPLSWGVTVVGDAGFGVLETGVGAGAYATLDTGFDFGGIWKFEWRLGLGVGAAFDLSSYYSVPFGLGIGEYSSSTWWFSDNFGVTFQDAYASSLIFSGPGLYAYTVGIDLKF